MSKPETLSDLHDCNTSEQCQIATIIGILTGEGIPCCLIGVSALRFYGAGRLLSEWEICINSANLQKAISIIEDRESQGQYQRLPSCMPQPASLTHTYPRYRGPCLNFQFVLVPAEDVRLHVDASLVRRSTEGLPYPDLAALVQSFLDTNDDVALCDVIDGTNISEEWGYKHLNLEGTNDLSWATRMNDRVSNLDGASQAICLYPTMLISKRAMWLSRVRGKRERMGWTQPESLFETQYRLKGSADPWTLIELEDTERQGAWSAYLNPMSWFPLQHLREYWSSSTP